MNINSNKTTNHNTYINERYVNSNNRHNNNNNTTNNNRIINPEGEGIGRPHPSSPLPFGAFFGAGW